MATRMKKKSKSLNGHGVVARENSNQRALTRAGSTPKLGAGVGIRTNRARVAGNYVDASILERAIGRRVGSPPETDSPFTGSSGAATPESRGNILLGNDAQISLGWMMVELGRSPDDLAFDLENPGNHLFQHLDPSLWAEMGCQSPTFLERDGEGSSGRPSTSKRISDSTPDMLSMQPRSLSNPIQHTSHYGRNEDNGNCSDTTSKPVDPERDEASQGLPFACPYFRLNPVKHETCLNYRLMRIRDVKQHLQRRHYITFYCPTCFHEFLNLSRRDDHIRSRDCLTPEAHPTFSNIDGVSRQTQSLLKGRVNRAVKPAEQWHAVWDILFGDSVDKPVDPYVRSVVRETFRMVRTFWRSTGPTILRRFLQSGTKEIEDPGYLEDIIYRLFHEVETQFEGRLNSPTTGSSSQPSTALQGSIEPVVAFKSEASQESGEELSASPRSSGILAWDWERQWDADGPGMFRSPTIDSTTTDNTFISNLDGTPAPSEFREQDMTQDEHDEFLMGGFHHRGIGAWDTTATTALLPPTSFSDTSLDLLTQQGHDAGYHRKLETGHVLEQGDLDNLPVYPDWARMEGLEN